MKKKGQSQAGPKESGICSIADSEEQAKQLLQRLGRAIQLGDIGGALEQAE